ncbi:Sec-independent protein translocase protein TatB [Pseudonocardia sp.]|uniref:Sec-independent protein translocase protein TatB n=1 Tax=Pseudonocardia sp. TaxID=60912 RepID=UPI003D0DEB55
MFDSVGWGEILVLVVAGLFILGPERLPGAAAWLGRTIKQVREYATGAREQLQKELGPEFDELRKPLEDLRGLRNLSPRAAVTRTLFDGEAPNFGVDMSKPPLRGGLDTTGSDGRGPAASNGNGSAAPRPAVTPLSPGERPPIDPDAT